MSCAATVLAGSLFLAPSALANFITPKAGGSPNANHIHTLYVMVLVLAIIVFLGVEGALVYAVYKFRASKGAVAQQIHGNTRLEIGWTSGAAVIVVLIAIVTFIESRASSTPPTPAPTATSCQPRSPSPTRPTARS